MRDTVQERDESLVEHRKPLSTEQEFEMYVWPKDAGGKTVKEAPIKENDHGMDAMRYAVAYVDKINAEPSRKLRSWSNRVSA
jgi:phage terminase large subunit